MMQRLLVVYKKWYCQKDSVRRPICSREVTRRAQSLLATWPLRYTGNDLIHRGKRTVEFSTNAQRHKLQRNSIINSFWLILVAALYVHNLLLYVSMLSSKLKQRTKKTRKKELPEEIIDLFVLLEIPKNFWTYLIWDKYTGCRDRDRSNV